MKLQNNHHLGEGVAQHKTSILINTLKFLKISMGAI